MEKIGEEWETDLSQLEKLKQFADDKAFLEEIGRIKRVSSDASCFMRSLF